MEKLGLTAIETHILERCFDSEITRRRKRLVVMSASFYAAILILVAALTQSWIMVLAVSLSYVVITGIEKVAYANGVIAYKSVILKLKTRIEDLENSGNTSGNL